MQVRAVAYIGLVTRRPDAADPLLVVALFVPAAALVGGDLAEHPWHLVLQVGLLVPLVWRRQAPMLVFGAVAVVAFAQWLTNVSLPADVGLLVALYTVAAYRSPLWTLLAGAVLEAGILMYAARWATGGTLLATVVSLSATALAAAVVGMNLRARRAYLASLEDQAVRQERERIARELHDIVSHNLSVMVALADGAAYAPDLAPIAMRQISGTGRQALTEMRRFLGVLRADDPDAERHPVPDIAALSALCGQVRAAGLPTSLDVAGAVSEVPAAAQLTVYRLAQEALTNTLKHAPAGTRAEVRVRCSAEEVAVEITDDGPAAVVSGHGHGIAGMRERVSGYGGSLSAGPRPGGGWRVSAHLPLRVEAEAA
jgi:signal transduction histidine kinase